jgi:prephenate dehydratase
MKIAIQGMRGSFHHQVADLIADNQAKIVPCTTFTEVFQRVENGEVPYGLTAVENSLHGSINEVYRLLERYSLWTTKSVRMPISQALISNHQTSLEELGDGTGIRILSQAPAFTQVELWLETHLPNAIREEAHDTADSVRMIMESQDHHAFAIAGEYAADIYDAHVIASNIQDDPDNYTRFILFQKEHAQNPDATHASIILKTDHSPGALLRALEVFALYNCNLTKLDSHPIPGDQQHYAFYIDYELGDHQSIVQELKAQGCTVKTLGEYTAQ